MSSFYLANNYFINPTSSKQLNNIFVRMWDEQSGDESSGDETSAYRLLTMFSLVQIFRLVVWWFSGKFSALRPHGRRFEPHSSRHVGTLGKSLTRSCLYNFCRTWINEMKDKTWCDALRDCIAVKFYYCYNLLSSVNTLLVNSLWYVRLYIKHESVFYYVTSGMS